MIRVMFAPHHNTACRRLVCVDSLDYDAETDAISLTDPDTKATYCFRGVHHYDVIGCFYEAYQVGFCDLTWLDTEVFNG